MRSMSHHTCKVLAVVASCLMMSGCYSCSLNGGWEGQMNPFCKKSTLVGLKTTTAIGPVDDHRR